MPTLYILGGPNGTGKTTFYETALLEEFVDSSLSFINADLIARSFRGGYTAENFAKADYVVREKISEHIKANADFMIESNMATQRDYDWVEGMKQRGYNVVLYFLCTSFIEININRVKKRVKEGGHDIAQSIIEHRYKMGLTYLKGNIHTFNKVYLIDNSQETAIVMAEVNNGILASKNSEAPAWVSDVLYIVERLKK